MSTNDKGFWQEKWRMGQTRWDLGGHHPLTPRLHQIAKEKADFKHQTKIYIPGSGRAHDGVYFVGHGHEVLAHDIVEEAIAEAQRLYQDVKGMSFEVADVMKVSSKEEGTFDAVFDRAMMCALSPDKRPEFIKAMSKRLKRGGLFMSLPFKKVSHGPDKGPPFQISEDELERLFKDDFELIHLEETEEGSTDAVILQEYIGVWRKI